MKEPREWVKVFLWVLFFIFLFITVSVLTFPREAHPAEKCGGGKPHKIEKIKVDGNGIKNKFSFSVKDIEEWVKKGEIRSYEIGPIPRVTKYKNTTGDFNYLAVKLQDILKKAVLTGRPQKLIVVVWAPDGFYASFSWGELFNSDPERPVYLAYKTQLIGTDEKLEYIKSEWKGPVRVVVSWDKINDERSVGWVEKIIVFYPLDFYPGHEYKKKSKSKAFQASPSG